MLDCHSLDPLVTPYIDGELPGADRRAIDDHLRACPPCHSRVAAERVVRDLIRARCRQLQEMGAPESLQRRCASALARVTLERATADSLSLGRPSGERRWASWRARVTPYALAASLVLVVGGAFVYQATDKSARVMAAELTADHVKCLALNRALGTHQTTAAVESSLASGFGWHVHLPENPARADLELVGARPCLYGEGKVAHIMYRHRGKPVSLFMLPNTARAGELVEVLGHEAAIWCVGNRTFVLVAREPKQDVERLASFVQTALR